jgi:hypothetical protein
MRSPSFRAPPRSHIGRSYSSKRFDRQRNPRLGYQKKNPAWAKEKRYTATERNIRRKHASWKRNKHGWKPDHCKGRWNCRPHRHRYPYYYYAYNDDWYDFYDYYDGPVQYDDAHLRWCKNRYRSYNVRTDKFLGYDGKYRRCISPFLY